MAYNLFDEKRVTVPLHLRPKVPEAALVVIPEVGNAAILAASGLRHLQALYDARHEAMCPSFPSPCTSRHVEFLERLFDKRLNRSGQPVLSRCSTPSQIMDEPYQFHTDQIAYDQYATFYSDELESYVFGTYMRWLEAKAKFEMKMREAILSDIDRQEWQWWYNKVYLVEMSKWEEQLKELVIPSWEEVVDGLHQALKEKAKHEPVDFPELNVVSGPG